MSAVLKPLEFQLDKRLDRFDAHKQNKWYEGEFRASLDCGTCKGSGEGRYEGLSCMVCHGRGSVPNPLAGMDVLDEMLRKDGFYDSCLTDFLCDAGRTTKEIDGRYHIPSQREGKILRRDLERDCERQMESLFNRSPNEEMTPLERALYRVMHMNAEESMERFVEKELEKA